MHPSEAAVVAAIEELGNGWIALPCDDATRGVLGYCLIERDPEDPKNPAEHLFEWPMLDRPLEPEVTNVSGRALIGFIREEADFLWNCDCARTLRIGFVSFRQAAEGKSIVRYSALSQIIQGLDQEEREELYRAREACRAKVDLNTRFLAAAALSTHEPLPDGVVPDPDPSQP